MCQQDVEGTDSVSVCIDMVEDVDEDEVVDVASVVAML